MNEMPILHYVPEKYRAWVMFVLMISPYLTRAYHAVRNGGGLRGILSAIWLGTNTPKPNPPAQIDCPPVVKVQPPSSTT